MKSLFTGLILGVFSLVCHAQPNGYEYVIQTDFGDAQDTIYPMSSQQWLYTPHWKNLQANFTQTDWFGPHYSPIGPETHGKYIMLDDSPNDYGAVAGNIWDLEYRLVECEFDYHLYDETDTNGIAHGGTLYILLTDKDTDIRSFDPDNPTDFETNGNGQLLFTFHVPGGIQGGRFDPWDKLSQTNPQDPSYRRAYALGKSPTGTPGSPFRYVGLVWRSIEFSEDRLLIDNFHLKDVCPDCVMEQSGYVQSGCFDHTWVSSIRNNYYYFTANVVDSATLAPIYQSVHQPATFSWDGVGNQGPWNGVLVPYGHPMKAVVRYYSCMKFRENVVALNYLPTRVSGCVDQAFGGSKVEIYANRLILWPNPISCGGLVNFEFRGRQPSEVTVTLRDLAGKELCKWPSSFVKTETGAFGVALPLISPGIFLFSVETDKDQYQRLIYILP